jgi:hypothetical protein
LTGRQFIGLEATPDMIDPVDIAYGLAHKYRWCGQAAPALTVAEHSVMVARIVKTLWPDREVEKAALLHDAVEGWWTDVPSPVKAFVRLHLPDGQVLLWDEMEDRILKVVGERFGLDPTLFNCPEVRAADLMARSLEHRDIFNLGKAGDPGLLPIPEPLKRTHYLFLCPGKAADRFLRAGQRLGLWTAAKVTLEGL